MFEAHPCILHLKYWKVMHRIRWTMKKPRFRCTCPCSAKNSDFRGWRRQFESHSLFFFFFQLLWVNLQQVLVSFHIRNAAVFITWTLLGWHWCLRQAPQRYMKSLNQSSTENTDIKGCGRTLLRKTAELRGRDKHIPQNCGLDWVCDVIWIYYILCTTCIPIVNLMVCCEAIPS